LLYQISINEYLSWKLAGGIRGCIGFVSDAKEKYYIPNTLLKADIRDYIVDSGRILITYRRDISEEKYSEIVYAAKKVDWKSLVPELHPMPSLC
jgi:hypothetical protein